MAILNVHLPINLRRSSNFKDNGLTLASAMTDMKKSVVFLVASRDTLHDTEGLHNTHQTCFHVTTNLEVDLTGTGISRICF